MGHHLDRPSTSALTYGKHFIPILVKVAVMLKRINANAFNRDGQASRIVRAALAAIEQESMNYEEQMGASTNAVDQDESASDVEDQAQRILRQIHIAYLCAPARLVNHCSLHVGVGRAGVWFLTGHFTHPPTHPPLKPCINTKKYFTCSVNEWSFVWKGFTTTSQNAQRLQGNVCFKKVPMQRCNKLRRKLLYKSLEQLPIYKDIHKCLLRFLGKMGISSTMSSSIFLKIQNPQHHNKLAARNANQTS